MSGKPLLQHLIVEAQKYTNMPWWNGAAYDEFHGLSASIWRMANASGECVDDLSDVIEWLRSEKQYDKADRLRTIAGRLARSRPISSGEDDLIREIARGWK